MWGVYPDAILPGVHMVRCCCCCCLLLLLPELSLVLFQTAAVQLKPVHMIPHCCCCRYAGGGRADQHRQRYRLVPPPAGC
jgi:hypothetical protein